MRLLGLPLGKLPLAFFTFKVLLGAFFQSMGSADGMETLFEQPLSILDAFLPPDRKESLRGLLAALNQ